MYEFEAGRTAGQKTEHLFTACVILLTGVGFITLYTSSYAYAQLFFGRSSYFIIRQAAFGIIGLILFFVFSRINLEKIRNYIFPLLTAAAVLCVLTLIPGIGIERLGASRWIRIGPVSYQPSEMIKFALPLYLAHFFDKKKDTLNEFNKGIRPALAITGFFLFLIYLQNNFSTAVLIMLNALVLFFISGIRLSYFISAFIIFVPISALLIFTRPHRVIRLVSFIKPEWDRLGAGYQVNASRLTIISGGLLGKGLGQGTRKAASVPEIHSDFIFSAYIEETGFLGFILFILMFIIFAVLGYRAALQSTSVFKTLLAAGLTTMILSQMLLNVAVVSGALPATGIPLPFFSAGGSSLVTTLISAGLIANVARTGRSLEGSVL
jgi:cell division protein FtsW